MNSIELAQRIRQLAATSAATDPADIAAEVIRGMSAKDAREALAVTLPNYVRLIVSARVAHLDAALSGQKLTASQESCAGQGRSRADRIRTWADGIRSMRVFVGDEWKHLGACTREDCVTVAAARGKQARELVVEAERWERVGRALDAAGVKTVAELADAALGAAWGDAA